MYNKSTIQTTAENLVGWSTSNDALYESIGRKTSDSGYYVNDLPGVTVNLLNYVDDEKNVSDYIESVHDNAILKVIDMVLQKKKGGLNTKELLQHNTLIQEVDTLEQTISKSGRFVGYAITPRESNTIASSILQAGFISGAADSFTLYLYDTSHKAAIKSTTVTTTSAETIAWTNLSDWDISFDREEGSAGQTYLIGYFEDDVTADLYDIAWSGTHAHTAQKIFGHYMGIRPVRFNSGTLDGSNIPNLQYLDSSVNCRSSGFNLRFNTKCNITKILQENYLMFGEALQLQIAVRILTDALNYATLNNVTNAQMLREEWKMLITEYNGKLRGGITEAGIPVKGLIDNLDLDFSNIDAVCLRKLRGDISYRRWS
jgi:hypothetical protein